MEYIALIIFVITFYFSHDSWRYKVFKRTANTDTRCDVLWNGVYRRQCRIVSYDPDMIYCYIYDSFCKAGAERVLVVNVYHRNSFKLAFKKRYEK